jgi:hypothetical protein
MARRSTFNEKLAERILDAVCEGASLTEASAACNVPRQTVRSWLDREPDFAAAFEAAKLVRVEALADQINILAESAQQVAADAAKNGGNPNAAVAALRVQCENKRWLLAKLAPATYGDRIAQEVSGPNGRDLIPAEPDPDKLALALLTVLHAGPGGKNDPATLPARPATAATTLLSGPFPAEPTEPVPIPVDPAPVETEAMRREHRRWVELTGPRMRVVE